MKLFVLFLVIALTAMSYPVQPGGEFCGVKNSAFQFNESLTYRVYYTLAGVFVAGGDAVFTTSLENVNGRTVYHIVGDGKTNSFFDNIFKVRDRYETYVDTATMQPLRFIRNVTD